MAMPVMKEVGYGVMEMGFVGAVAGVAAGAVAVSLPVAAVAAGVGAAATGIFLIADRIKHKSNHVTGVFRRPAFWVLVSPMLVGYGICSAGAKAVEIGSRAVTSVRNGVHNFTATKLTPPAK